MPSRARSSELTSVDGEWVVEELLTWFRNVPQSRGVYILTRIDPDTFALEGGVPIRGENYDLVHVAFSESATSTHTFTFSLPFPGDAAIPSGTYMFFAAELPETKSVYDPATDTDTTSPYTDDDLAAWLADRSSQDTFGPDAYTEAAIFEYVNDGPPPCTEDCFSNVLFCPESWGRSCTKTESSYGTVPMNKSGVCTLTKAAQAKAKASTQKM